MSDKKTVNCLNIAYIFKTSVGSINGSWTEGNVTTVKKITLPDGNAIPYVSGQSIKYQIRKGWKEAGLGDLLSDVRTAEKSKGVNFTEGDPETFLDDDLLGYMIASKGENRRRTAPVRVSPAIGIFPFRGDRDLGTKSKEETGGDMGAGGNMFETEIYYNYFKVNFMLELDRIGKFMNSELAEGGKNKKTALELKDRRTRVKHFLNALAGIWGGGKQTRLLTDVSPKFIAVTFQTSKVPIFLESLTVNDDETLNTSQVSEVLNDYSNIIEHKLVGVRTGIFKNDVSSLKDYKTIQEVFDETVAYLENLEF